MCDLNGNVWTSNLALLSSLGVYLSFSAHNHVSGCSSIMIRMLSRCCVQLAPSLESYADVMRDAGLDPLSNRLGSLVSRSLRRARVHGASIAILDGLDSNTL